MHAYRMAQISIQRNIRVLSWPIQPLDGRSCSALKRLSAIMKFIRADIHADINDTREPRGPRPEISFREYFLPRNGETLLPSNIARGARKLKQESTLPARVASSISPSLRC